MNSTEKVFNRFFRPYIHDLVWYITLFSQTIILFFAGFIYGDAPVDIKFTCEIPSTVYEYEVGDTVEIHATIENVGRPFKAVKANAIDISVYTIIDNKMVTPYEEEAKDELPWERPEELIQKNYKSDAEFVFTIKENAPKGDYIVRVSAFGVAKTFEGLISVK